MILTQSSKCHCNMIYKIDDLIIGLKLYIARFKLGTLRFKLKEIQLRWLDGNKVSYDWMRWRGMSLSHQPQPPFHKQYRLK